VRGWRRGRSRAPPHAPPDGLDVVARWATARRDQALHLVKGGFVQQWQDAHEVLDTAAGALLFLQGFAEIAIQPCRPAWQGTQVVVRIENLLVFAIGMRRRGDHRAAAHDGKAVAVGLDADGPERRGPGHAIAVVVETHHLVLIGLGGLDEARIEGPLG
jgi:hypothetical protein